MTFRELTIAGAFEITPQQHGDPRGLFLELFQGGPFREHVGHAFGLAQANLSVSAAGVLRGVHYADVPPGQAKYVTCPAGAVLDIVVDLRDGSPTFGRWDAVLLDDVNRRAVYLSEGLGHAFCSLADGSTVVYLCSTPYTPQREHGVHPMDVDLDIRWPTIDRGGREMQLQLSEKDTAAPTLMRARAEGLLPTWNQTAAYVSSLPG